MKLKLYILLLLIFIIAGSGWITIENRPKPLLFETPAGWPVPSYNFSENPLTEEAFQLGRKLFYDGRLSKDGNFPCASCHQQFAAFATYDHNVSHGINNSFTERNSPPLFNLAWQKEFMWDGGVNHLDVQPLTPITAVNEMGESIDSVLQKLRNDNVYKKMFKDAFGSDEINTKRMSQALSQFLLMIVSSESKYDRVMRGKDSFNLPERLGYAIFKNSCASCHQEPLFTDFSYRNTGLPQDDYIKDEGRKRVTRKPEDSLKFRVPSLRNIQLTFPYEHDGRFYSLKEAIMHYRNKKEGSNVDPLVKNGIPLSNFEVGQLTAFLYTLTDSALLTDKRFSPPELDRSEAPPAEHIH